MAVLLSVGSMTLASAALMAYALWQHAQPRVLLALMGVVVLTMLTFATCACLVLW